jgi:hypothetical protein
MEEKKYFWTTKEGEQIDVDKMSIEHLRNVLKMIIRNKEKAKVEYDNIMTDASSPEWWKE